MKNLILALMIIVGSQSFAQSTVSSDEKSSPKTKEVTHATAETTSTNAEADDKVPAAEPGKIDFSEPPYYMISYDEISDLIWSQKNFYFKKIVPHLNKLEPYKKTKVDNLKNWVADRTEWEKLMTDVYTECVKTPPAKFCKDLEEIRIEAISLEGRK